METELEQIDKEIKKLEERRLFLVNRENHAAIAELGKRRIYIHKNDREEFRDDTESDILHILETGICHYNIDLIDAIEIIRGK